MIKTFNLTNGSIVEITDKNISVTEVHPFLPETHSGMFMMPLTAITGVYMSGKGNCLVLLGNGMPFPNVAQPQFADYPNCIVGDRDVLLRIYHYLSLRFGWKPKAG